VNEINWVKDLKNAKWYGPFEYFDSQYPGAYLFHTATDSGNFQGLTLAIYKFYKGGSYKDVVLYFTGINGQICGSGHSFKE